MGDIRRRMRPQQRREALVAQATVVFARSGYRATTTAELAAAAGVTQPILYRHFRGKTELYLACLERAWLELRQAWHRALDEEPDPRSWLSALTMSGLQMVADPERAQLWLRSLVDGEDDPRVRDFVVANLREVHAFVADVVERARAAGGIVADAKPRAEAWQFLATGLLFAMSNRLGNVVDGDDFLDVIETKYAQLTPQR